MPSRSPSGDGRIHGVRPGVRTAPEQLPLSPWVTALFCLLSLSWVLAFTPTPLAVATIPGVVGWLAVIERCRRFREVALWLTLFGATATVIGYQWLAPTITDFGGVDPSLAWLATALFGVWGIAHGLLFAAFYRGLLLRGNRPHPFLVAVLIVAAETLPIRLFAWMGGHGAVDVPPLVQAAEWGGVPAVSLALYLLVVPIYEWLRWAFVRGGAPARPKAALVTFLAGAVLFGVGAFRYQQIRTEEREAERHVRVAIAQANVGSHVKRDMENHVGQQRSDGIAAYREVTAKAVAAKPDLIVWPETAITDAIPLQRDPQTNHYLRGTGYDFLIEAGEESAFLIGMYEKVIGRESLLDGRPIQIRYNVAALRATGDETAAWSAYRKVYLIPFGEMTPFGLFDHYLPQQTFRMTPGDMPQELLEHRGITYAPFICYEGILAGHVREVIGEQRADVLVSLTNDSWFGGSWEPYQHLNFTRFRAVEHRCPMVRATNTGISAFVSATGDVEERLGVGEKGAIVREVPLVDRERTFYARWGHKLPVVLWIVAALGWILSLMRPPPIVRSD